MILQILFHTDICQVDAVQIKLNCFVLVQAIVKIREEGFLTRTTTDAMRVSLIKLNC